MSAGIDLEAYGRALLAGDAEALARFASPAFAAEGSADAVLAYRREVADLRERLAAFGGGAPPRFAALAQAPNRAVVAVTTEAGGLIYEDTLHLDGEGRVLGDRRPYEVCAKLRFAPGQPPRRALAIRPWGCGLRTAVPLGVAALDAVLTAPGDDGFYGLTFTLPDDDLRTRPLRLAVAAESAAAAPAERGVVRLEVILRGADHPHFRAALHPRVEGALVRLPPGANPRALAVALADGTAARLRNPARPVYRFAAPVTGAVLSDALDHDWSAF